MSKFENLVFIVNTPSASPHDANQIRSLGLVSRAVHARSLCLHSLTDVGRQVSRAMLFTPDYHRSGLRTAPLMLG